MGDTESLPGKEARGWLAWLDRATEWRLCFLIVSFVLAVDFVLAASMHSNLLRFTWTWPNTRVHLGSMALFVAVYLLYMAVLAPCLALVMEQLWRRLADQWSAQPNPIGLHGPSATLVRPHRVLDRAL